MFTDDGTTYTFSTVSDCKDATCISMKLCQDKSKCKHTYERCLVNKGCTDKALPGTGLGCKKSCDGNDFCGCAHGKCYKGNEDPRCNWISNGEACV